MKNPSFAKPGLWGSDKHAWRLNMWAWHWQASIMGYSMGGHGALTIGLTFPEQYRSISALAPVCTPASSIVGQHYFNAALGPDREVHAHPLNVI